MKRHRSILSALLTITLLYLWSCITVPSKTNITPKSPQHTQKTIRVKEGDLNYEIIGQGRPIVMIHDFYLDRRSLKGCMEPLFSGRSGWKRIYFDLPGMGTTQRVTAIHNADGMLDFAMEVVRKVIPGQRFLLVGDAYGGYLAQGIVRNHPDLVDGLVLIRPLGVVDESGRDLPFRQILIKEDLSAHQLTAMDGYLLDLLVVKQNEGVWKRFEAEWVPGFEAADRNYLDRIRQGVSYSLSFDVDDMEAMFEKPALIIAGRQDSIVGYKDIWNQLDNYPRATFAVLDLSGHALPIEQEEIFNALVDEWLDRVSVNQ